MPLSDTSRSGRFFAAAAVAVTAPRLALAFLLADGVPMPIGVRVTLLTLSSIATAVALTGGGAYLARAIAAGGRRRKTLTVLWAAALFCSSALIAPVIVTGLLSSPLAQVLPSPLARWAWAICAVLAVDLIAAGTMRADVDQGEEREELERSYRRMLDEVESQRDQARVELAAARRQVPKNPPQSFPEAGSGSHSCATCGTVWKSAKALGAHRRWCTPGRTAEHTSSV